jgi:hypothetical protein
MPSPRICRAASETGASYPVIDFLGEDGTATRIKSIDLNGTTYQDAARLTYRINDYVRKLANFDGANYGKTAIAAEDITNRVLHVVVPKGSVTDAQQEAFDAAINRAKSVGITLKVTQY